MAPKDNIQGRIQTMWKL